MLLIVGLGNPGQEYHDTRHNIGFEALDYIANVYNVNYQAKKQCKGLIANIQVSDEQIILLKPDTFMNLSGYSVQATMNFYKININNIVVLHDELDIQFGKVKIKASGSGAGHNGVSSIIKHIGNNFYRVRLGIGRPENPHINISDYVLSKFTSQEKTAIDTLLKELSNAVNLEKINTIEDYVNQIKGLNYVS